MIFCWSFHQSRFLLNNAFSIVFFRYFFLKNHPFHNKNRPIKIKIWNLVNENCWTIHGNRQIFFLYYYLVGRFQFLRKVTQNFYIRMMHLSRLSRTAPKNWEIGSKGDYLIYHFVYNLYTISLWCKLKTNMIEFSGPGKLSWSIRRDRAWYRR